eukprot:6208115-Pleurochrysis_carterae.AAC.2
MASVRILNGDAPRDPSPRGELSGEAWADGERRASFAAKRPTAGTTIRSGAPLRSAMLHSPRPKFVLVLLLKLCAAHLASGLFISDFSSARSDVEGELGTGEGLGPSGPSC